MSESKAHAVVRQRPPGCHPASNSPKMRRLWATLGSGGCSHKWVLAVSVEPETARGSGLAASNPTGVWAAQGEPNRPVSVAEFLFIACVVGVLTETWLGFLGTFFGLYALYRFTRLSAVLSLALSLYWGLLGYHPGRLHRRSRCRAAACGPGLCDRGVGPSRRLPRRRARDPTVGAGAAC